MKKNIKFLAAFALLTVGLANAQVGVGTTMPDGSAVLDVSSTTKGLLLPRLDATQRGNISLPATGLMIYNTTNNVVQFNSGSPASPVWTNAGGATPYQNIRGNMVTFTGSRNLAVDDFIVVSVDNAITNINLPDLAADGAAAYGRIVVVVNSNTANVVVNVNALPIPVTGAVTVIQNRCRTYMWTGARWNQVTP